VNTATPISTRGRTLLAALVTTLLVVSGLSLAAQPARAAAGDVTSATLDWGIKASFRNYITSPIAHGSWTVAGNVTDATPFSFTGGTGTMDAAAGTGRVGYTGSIHFQGHEGMGVPAGSYALDMTVSNVRLVKQGATAAQLVVDIVTNSTSAPTTFVTSTDVPFATVDLAAATVTSTATTVGYSGAPAVLTAEGAASFAGFYTAGTALDPVSFRWPVEQAPAPAQATSTTLAVPSTAVAGQPVTLSASVAPAAAAGSVRFADGATSLGVVPVVSGAASTSVALAAGTRSITAIFTPADAALFAASTSTSVTVTVSAAPVVTKPTITVSKSTVSTAGETITVTGAGFGPAGTATNASRPPLAGKFGGAYVTFGRFADVWKPSAGATSSARVADRSTLKWVVNPADVATVGGPSAGAIPINADGTFSVQMLVKPGFTGAPATGNYGIYTYPGGGVSYAAFETFTPITFADTPVVTVSKTTLSAAGETVTVSGSGFGPAGTATNASRPPLAGRFGGAYVTFGKFASVWKPSAGAASSARAADRSTLKWVVNPADVATVGGASAGAIPIGADGTFSVEMLVKPGFTGEPATGNYGVYTYPGGGVSYAPFETFTPITFVAGPVIVPTPIATTTTLTASPTAITVGDTTTLSAQVAPAAAGAVTFSLGSTTIGTVATSASGAATIPVSGLSVGEQQLTARFVPADGAAFAGSSGATSVTVSPVAAPVSVPPAVGAGSLAWGVKQSFRDYVTGPIAKGAISTSGVGSSGGAFTFAQTGGTVDAATGVGTATYGGSVRFTGHAGLLDVTLGNPVVRIDGPTRGTLLVSVDGGASTPMATLDLAAGTRSTPQNTVAYSGVPASLTAQGAAVFSLNGSGFYPVGTALDPLSFTIGAPAAAPAALGATTIAAFKVAKTAAPTPPATTGITVVQGTELTEGDEVTVTASGFRPGEKGILVVIYSTPVVLSTSATADAAGTVTWTGRLPAGLTGTHTLTFQGSVDRGVELTIAGAAQTAVAGCVVDDASLTWGFKESFRSYISGSIANGEWVVADGATYAVPDFGWSAGTGGYDPETGEGSLAFAGSIAFTGHGGVLNTTVANPQVRFDDATSATLLLDVSGTTQDGAAVDSRAVEFAALDLTGAITADASAFTVTDAAATLTDAGAAAFGTYPSGEALDPVTLVFSAAADCAVAEEAAATDEAVATTTDAEPVSAEEPADLGWIIWVLAALLVIAVAVIVVLVVRGRTKK
jgi:hypothetical protein